MEYRKGHMALVSDDPGGQSGAIGVITLEDVIEELIGEVKKDCQCPCYTMILIE